MSTSLCLLALSALAPQGESAAQSRTSYVSGEAVVKSGFGLDLDSGGVFPGRWTVRGGINEIAWPCPTEGKPSSAIRTRFKADDTIKVPGGYAAPVFRVTTDRGKTAWVQFAYSSRFAVVRFVVRVSGAGAVLPAPTEPFCVGGDGRIAVHFTGDKRFASYRIERREGVDGRFELFADAAQSGFVDTKSKPGVRYGYRITGVAANGDRGLPAAVQGTTASRGVRTGRIEAGKQPVGIDLLTGKTTTAAAGDIVFYGPHAGDWQSFSCGSLPDAPVDTASFWDCWYGASRPGIPFLVRVRGGGVARCVINGEGDGHVLTFAVNPDGPRMPAGPVLRRVDGAGARGPVVLNADSPKGFSVRTITARNLESDTTRQLPCRNRAVVDRVAKKGDVIEYRAYAVDVHDRRSNTRRLVVPMRPGGIRRGTFRFHYKQGFSFVLEKVCPPGAADADVVFESCAGGISSVTLKARRGIVGLASLDPRLQGTAPGLFSRLHGVDPSRDKSFHNGQSANGDDRRGPSDVFVMRTRAGGWVKLAIVKRATQGGWNTLPAVVHWVHNPDASVFVKGNPPEFDKNGLAFGEPTEGAQAGPGLKVEKVKAPAEPVAAKAGPPIALPARQEILFDRSRHNYVRATFSFEYGTRDDRARTRNDWDIQLSRGHVHVRMVVDDISTISDLGKMEWKNLSPQALKGIRFEERIKVQKDHLYLVHTVDRDSDLYSLFHVVDHVPGDRCTLTWVSLLDGELKHAPDFPKERGTRAKVKAILHLLRSGGVRAGVGDYYRTPVWKALEQRFDGQVETGTGYKAFLTDLAKRLGTDVVIDESVAEVKSKLPRLDGAGTWFEVLELATRHARLHWFIDGQGRIALLRDKK